MSNETILPPAPTLYRLLDAFAVFTYRDKDNTQLVCACEDERVARDLAAQPGPAGKAGFVREIKILTEDGRSGNVITLGDPIVILPRVTNIDEIRRLALCKLDPAERVALGYPAT